MTYLLTEREIVNAEGLLRFGTEWWKETYRRSPHDGDAMREVQRFVLSRRPPEAKLLARVLSDHGAAALVLGCAKWVHCGAPRLIPHGHKYASALMCTALNAEVDVHVPWPTFVVDIPDRLLSTRDEDGSEGWITRALVHSFDTTDGLRYSIVGIGDNATLLSSTYLSRAELVSDEQVPVGDPGPFNIEYGAEDMRTSLLLRRYVVGICIDAAALPVEKIQVAAPATEGAGAPPKSRVFRIGRPVSIDCRETVRDFSRGAKRSTPAVNWMVRGHYRNQACGPGLRDRKVIWIEPHWGNNKAGSDARVALRPHVVGKGKSNG